MRKYSNSKKGQFKFQRVVIALQDINKFSLNWIVWPRYLHIYQESGGSSKKRNPTQKSTAIMHPLL